MRKTTCTLLATAGLLLGVPAQGERFLAFGDSITHGLGDPGVDCDMASGGYPPRLESLLRQTGRLEAVEVLTFGVCGETTAGGLSRIDTVLPVGGDVIVIMEGTNDISAGVGIETMRFNVREMARKAREAGIEPVYSSVIPRTRDATPDVANERAALFRGWMEADAAAGGYAFADPFSVFLPIVEQADVYYSDPFHPSAVGYDLLAEVFVEPVLEGLARSCGSTEPCSPDPNSLCLNQDRFRVTATWRDFEGKTGSGQAVGLTGDTGYFWFFDDANVELILKVLDGRGTNDHFWVFYGALSNVEYTIAITDTETGQCRRYQNPLETFASVGDTRAFFVPPDDGTKHSAPKLDFDPGLGSLPEGYEWRAAALPAATRSAASRSASVAPKMTCEGGAESLCLNQERFEVEVEWTDFEGQRGVGKAQPLSSDTGYFWFFDPDNVEIVVKVLDGRGVNGFFWVFYGALSNVEYTMTVTDTETGEVATFGNPLGNFASVGDTSVFPQ